MGKKPWEKPMFKRLFSIISALCLLLALAACGPAQPAPEESGGRVVEDALGREVRVPETVESIVVLGNTPRMAVYLGLADMVAGYSGLARESVTPLAAYAYVTLDDWAEVPSVGTDSGGNTAYYSEEIILTNADVIFCTATGDVADELQRETGIPCLSVSQGTLFGEDMEQSLRIMAEVCGVQERAEAIFDYVDGCFAELESLTGGIPESERKTALPAAATFRGTHGIEGVRANDPVMLSVNALNAADALSDGYESFTVDKEQILAWNPEYIFLDSGGVPLVRQDYAAHSDYYAELSAVALGRVYQYPSSTSYYDNMEISLLNCYFVGSVLYPERFAEVDFEAKAAEIFGFFLGDEDYLDVLAGYGAYYGTVELDA